jgi:ABC-type transport system involved in cytochrome c biogenesis permease subunit
MNHLLPVFRCAVPTLYILTLLLYGLHFFGRGRAYARFARPALLTSLLVHLLYLTVFIVVHRRIPLAAAPEILTVVAFMTGVAYLYVETRTRNLATGVFLLGFTTLVQIASSGRIQLQLETPPLLRVPLFGLHAGAAIFGYSAFAVSAVYGVLFLLLYHDLKSTHFGLIYRRMPPLDVLCDMNIRAAAIGLASLTVAILAGVAWAMQIQPGFPRDPMFLITLVVWAIYAACVLAYYGFGWRGKRSIYLSITGFVLMGLTLVAVTLFRYSFHRFGSS